MAITYPQDCSTPGDRTEWLLSLQEVLRHFRNLFYYWSENDITQVQYDSPPLSVVQEELRPIVKTWFNRLKSKYPYSQRLSKSEWQKFKTEEFEPRQEKVNLLINANRTLSKKSTRWPLGDGNF